MSYDCEFCKNKFVNKCGLLYHQRTAKYCLKLQGINSTKYICKYCDKNLTDKRLLEGHEEKCGLPQKIQLQHDEILKHEKKNIILQHQLQSAKDTITILREQISELQSRLENVAVQGVKKSTTTTNNIVNIENLTDEWLKTSSKNLTLDHIERGPQGYAEFASQHSLKDRVKCVDFARRILQYKEDDAIIRDKKGKKLSKKFFQSIESQNKELVREAMDKITEEMDDKTPEELDRIMEKMTKFLDMNSTDMVENQELKDSFVKELCELL
jgi:hypothetical protein